MAGGSECVAGARSSPRLSQIQKMKAAKRAELAAVSKFSQVEEEDNREGKARAATGPLIAVPDPNFFCQIWIISLDLDWTFFF